MATTCFPVILSGDNLGERHRFLNTLVNDTYNQGVAFYTVQDLSELSPIDRIFKIDLASKYKNIDYIIETLKDEDLLYVRRALKCTWILKNKYSHIINPQYLEDMLFPEMLSTAVTLTNHFVELNLKDPERCEVFYNYYIKKNFNTAVKFLKHCSNDFLLSNIINILDKLTPQHLKYLSEKCPKVAEVYYDNLQDNEIALDNYLNDQEKYYTSIRGVLKLDADIFLDITEKYFDTYSFHRFSRSATKYIINNHKHRFINKIELYTAWLLNLDTLGKSLSSSEIENIILQLARAQYLNLWFSYQNVEPLLKYLNSEKRTRLKKQVFVDKSFGNLIENWPYTRPSKPEIKVKDDANIFKDFENSSFKNEHVLMSTYRSGMVRKKRANWFSSAIVRSETFLDHLFNRFRFVSFERTFHELSKLIKAESSSRNREHIMLVLVSKSGGRVESLCLLLRLLSEHLNEPSNLRATIVRSLVRRAAVWRLPSDSWENLMKFAHNLGLDGGIPDAACYEGLHAVVLRCLLEDNDCEPTLWNAFLKHFSSLSEYSLTVDERRCVRERLPSRLLLDAVNAEPGIALERLTLLLDTLDAYKMRLDNVNGVIDAIINLADRDLSIAKPLLQRLYNQGIARRILIKQNFTFIQTDQSYLNALRHDVELLVDGKEFECLLSKKDLKHTFFLRKLTIYFGESGGLARRYYDILEHYVKQDPHVSLARPFAVLVGSGIHEKLKAFSGPKKSPQAMFAAALRANVHITRPLLKLDAISWRELGAKAIANRVLICSAINKDHYIKISLAWRRTLRIALLLSLSNESEAAVLEEIAQARPVATLKVALRYLSNNDDERAVGIWSAVKTIIEQLDLNLPVHQRQIHTLAYATLKRPSLQAEYCVTIYNSFCKISKQKALPILFRIEDVLPSIQNESIYKVTKEFVEDELIAQNLNSGYVFNKCAFLHIRLIAKSLLLCRNVDEQEHKYLTIAKPFLDRMELLWNTVDKQTDVLTLFDKFIYSLQYSKAFLDRSYISCIPLFERILNQLRTILPVEQWFHKYVNIHLTMLFYKSIQQSLKQKPEAFADETAKQSHGVEIVGTVFGKYIAHELQELLVKYFPSIRELYSDQLVDFFIKYFFGGTSRCKLINAVVKSMIQEDNNSRIVACNLLRETNTKNTDVERILKSLKRNNIELAFFLNA